MSRTVSTPARSYPSSIANISWLFLPTFPGSIVYAFVQSVEFVYFLQIPLHGAQHELRSGWKLFQVRGRFSLRLFIREEEEQFVTPFFCTIVCRLRDDDDDDDDDDDAQEMKMKPGAQRKKKRKAKRTSAPTSYCIALPLWSSSSSSSSSFQQRAKRILYQ